MNCLSVQQQFLVCYICGKIFRSFWIECLVFLVLFKATNLFLKWITFAIKLRKGAISIGVVALVLSDPYAKHFSVHTFYFIMYFNLLLVYMLAILGFRVRDSNLGIYKSSKNKWFWTFSRCCGVQSHDYCFICARLWCWTHCL